MTGVLNEALFFGVVIPLLIGCASTRAAADGDNASGDEVGRIQLAMGGLFAAVRDENEGGVRQFLAADHDRGKALISAQARRIVASTQFAQACVDHIEPRHIGALMEELRIVNPEALIWSLQGPEWHVTKDRAVGKYEELEAQGYKPPPLVKDQGVWKIDVTSPGKYSQKRRQELIDAIDKQTKLIAQTAVAIREGKLKTPAEVKAAMKDRPAFAPQIYSPDVILSLPDAAPPATAPATQQGQ